MRIDYHIHTDASHDCWTKIESILNQAEEQGLDAVAITDHDTVDGAMQASRLASNWKVKVIPGVERTIPTGKHGIHLLALFIDYLPSGDSITQFIQDVRDQDGCIIIPHPCRQGTGLFYHRSVNNISQETLEFVLQNVDAIEAVNWKDRPKDIYECIQFLSESDIPIVAGTDAHTAKVIGSVWTDTTHLHPSNQSKIGTFTTATPSDELESTIEGLVGHTTSSSNSQLWDILSTLGREVCNLFPGNEPDNMIKKLLKYLRGVRVDIKSSHASSSKIRVQIYREESSRQIKADPIQE